MEVVTINRDIITVYLSDEEFYDHYEELFSQAVIKMGGNPDKGLGGGLPAGITLDDIEAVMLQIFRSSLRRN